MRVTNILKRVGVIKVDKSKQMAIKEFIIKVDEVRVERGKKVSHILYLEEKWEWVIIRHPNLQKTVAFKAIKGGTYLSIYLAHEVYKQLNDLPGKLTAEDLYTLTVEVPLTAGGRVDGAEIRKQSRQIKEGVDCI